MRPLLGLLVVACTGSFLTATTPQEKPASQEAKRPGVDGNLVVTVGMSMIIDSPAAVLKLSIANGDLAQAVAITPKEVLINGKAPGETSLIVWQEGGARLVYDLTVRISSHRLDMVRQQIARDFPDEEISITFENDTAFVRGTVKDTYEAGRVMAIVASLGPKAVNLLRVNIPAEAPQILLKVRFADVDRSQSLNLGINIASTAFNQVTGISTGQFGSAGVDGTGTFNLSNALNVLLFRKDINLGATIEALQAKNLLQMLAEPNVMATSGQPASFIDGGKIPVPVLQSSLTPGAVNVQYYPYGIQLNFLPEVTPRGTIHLKVTPEVSAPDYSNSVSVAGTTVPGFTSKRVDTEVELEAGQSFVIAGLLDNQTTETLNKIPGLANLPILGKLFQSRAKSKSNSELLVIVTPELVRPIPANQKLPELNFTTSFMEPNSHIPLRQPGMDQTGPLPIHPPNPSMPVEQLIQEVEKTKSNPAPQTPNSPQSPAQGPAPGSAPPSGSGGNGNSSAGASR
jgi:pilus assembly protein CpaC